MLDSSGDIKDLAPCVELSELFLDGTLVGGNIRNFRQMRNLSQLSLANCPKIHGRKPEEWETSTLDSRIHNGTGDIQVFSECPMLKSLTLTKTKVNGESSKFVLCAKLSNLAFDGTNVKGPSLLSCLHNFRQRSHRFGLPTASSSREFAAHGRHGETPTKSQRLQHHLRLITIERRARLL